MLGIGRTYLENVRNYLATNDIIPRVYGNIKRVPQWKAMLKYMDYQVLVEMSTKLLKNNGALFCLRFI